MEEKIEYRDQDGNLLDENQVAELEGKVSFKTRYETRTRVLDADGNEVNDDSAGSAGTAPPHPADREPETAADQPEDDGREYPATASPEDDVGKEKSVKKNDDGKPRPASEAKDATKKDEL
jgi:dolichyl-phosphate-mannose-protein mannosyltransferase